MTGNSYQFQKQNYNNDYMDDFEMGVNSSNVHDGCSKMG